MRLLGNQLLTAESETYNSKQHLISIFCAEFLSQQIALSFLPLVMHTYTKVAREDSAQIKNKNTLKCLQK